MPDTKSREKRRGRIYSDDLILEIVRLYSQGFGPTRISERTGISMSYVEKILRGKSRIDLTGGRIICGYREQYRSEAAKFGWKRRKERCT